jgi:Holliday junction DNA helicase RuvA
MIAHLSGEITATGEDWVVIDLHGLGYRVHVPRTSLTEIASMQGKVKLVTHLAVREDALTLYGFLHPEELEMFQLLIAVTRVGPQLALSILSQIPVPALAAALIEGDERALTRISGVGQKNAKRLILELKDRVQGKAGVFLRGPAVAHGQPREDAVKALIALGFPPRDSEAAVHAAASQMNECTTEALVRAALTRVGER